MNSYLDTSFIISYILTGDQKHSDAINLFNKVRNDDFYISTLTILEMYSVLTRRINDYRIPPSFENSATDEMKVKIAVKYTLENMDFSVLPDINVLERLDTGTETHKIYKESIQLAPKFKLRALDLMHATYVSLNNNIDNIVSFDKDFKSKIESNTNISVICE